MQLGAGQGLDERDRLSETEAPALCVERGPLRSGTDDLERDVDAAAPRIDRDCVDQHVEPLLGGESARCDETPRGALREWLQRCVDDHGHPHHTAPRWVEAEGRRALPPTTALRPRRRSRLATAPRDRDARTLLCAAIPTSLPWSVTTIGTGLAAIAASPEGSHQCACTTSGRKSFATLRVVDASEATRPGTNGAMRGSRAVARSPPRYARRS